MTTNLHQAQSHDILRSWQSQRNDINHHKDFVLPLFIGNNDDAIEAIESMPEVYRYGCNTAIDYLAPLVDKHGLRSILLFPVVTKIDRVRLDNDRDAMSDEDDGAGDTSSEGSSSSRSTLENSSSSDGEDRNDQFNLAEHLLGEDEQANSSPSLNPFLSHRNEDEDHLLAGEQGNETNSTNAIKSAPVAPPNPPPRVNEKALIKTSQVQDIKLIKGMALKERYNPVLRLIPRLRAKFPKLLIICDVCLCAFTSTGHCCLFEDHARAKGEGAPSSTHTLHSFPISNKTTCQYLAMLAVEYARRGCDVIAPSDMMDGRILSIREKLNDSGLFHVSIMSYSAKFASAYYGPFRQATDNAPEFGDRRAYQLPPGSRALASKAVKRDIDQGADFVMVKPGGLYLDIVRDIRERHPDVPVAIYQVSGEYSMLKLAAKNGLIDQKLAVAETLTAFRRAGATIIISYFTPEILKDEHLANIL